MMIPVAVSANDRKYSAWDCENKFGKFTFTFTFTRCYLDVQTEENDVAGTHGTWREEDKHIQSFGGGT
jgi:hypothetical protein